MKKSDEEVAEENKKLKFEVKETGLKKKNRFKKK